MALSSGLSNLDHAPESAPEIPELSSLQLLPQIEPWGQSFRRNLFDALFGPKAAPVAASSASGQYWQDVFVDYRLPWARFAQSVLYHGLAIAAIYGFSLLPTRPSTLSPAHKFDSSQVVYYSNSEYLPPIDTGNPGPSAQRQADPELAKQPILSVPPEARNREQTIVSPPEV